MPDIAGEKGRTDSAAIDAVAIGFRARRLAGMEAGRDFVAGENPNRGRQNVIERKRQIRGWNHRIGGKRRHLFEGVHARIRPSRALRQYVFAGDSSNSRTERALNAGCIGLDLPATEVGAVVGQGQFQIAHGESKSRILRDAAASKITSWRFRESKGFLGYTVAFSKTPDCAAFYANVAERGTLGRVSA